MNDVRKLIPIKLAGAQGYGEDLGDWQRVSTLSEPLLTKVVEHYKAIGYEVDIRDMQRTEVGCGCCFEAGSEAGEVFGTLFVRRSTAMTREDDELFDEGGCTE